MFKMQQSILFIRQWQDISDYYNDKAGRDVAVRFVHSVDSSLLFIQENPYSCMVYNAGKFKYGEIYQFRKWNIRGFPHVIFFHILETNIITIDAIYAHKMNISSRLVRDDD